ncbi:hypothetical protein D3C72_1382240 [compost metagenome]
MPRASPSRPLVRANSTQWVAVCMPVVHIFSPSMRKPARPWRASGTARVAMWVASEPCCGSVRPKVRRTRSSSMPWMSSSHCAGVPKSRMASTKGLLATIECSFCKSLCRPRPRAAKCSRITAIQRLLPSRPPNAAGNAKRRWPARSARRRASASSASHSGRGRPPFSKSVRAHSRRWSKKRSLSSCACSGATSRSMKASSSAR